MGEEALDGAILGGHDDRSGNVDLADPGLGERYRVVAPELRGHGRGMRTIYADLVSTREHPSQTVESLVLSDEEEPSRPGEAHFAPMICSP